MLAEENGTSEQAISADMASLMNLELYVPVPTHRSAWTGDAKILVATAGRDQDAPVAFDAEGRRYLLDRDVPPSTPVLHRGPVSRRPP